MHVFRFCKVSSAICCNTSYACRTTDLPPRCISRKVCWRLCLHCGRPLILQTLVVELLRTNCGSISSDSPSEFIYESLDWSPLYIQHGSLANTLIRISAGHYCRRKLRLRKNKNTLYKSSPPAQTLASNRTLKGTDNPMQRINAMQRNLSY